MSSMYSAKDSRFSARRRRARRPYTSCRLASESEIPVCSRTSSRSRSNSASDNAKSIRARIEVVLDGVHAHQTESVASGASIQELTSRSMSSSMTIFSSTVVRPRTQAPSGEAPRSGVGLMSPGATL